MCNLLEHTFCTAPVLKQEKQVSLPLCAPKPSDYCMEVVEIQVLILLLLSKPCCPVEGAQLNRLEDILQRVPAASVCKSTAAFAGWEAFISDHCANTRTWEHVFSLWPKEYLKITSKRLQLTLRNPGGIWLVLKALVKEMESLSFTPCSKSGRREVIQTWIFYLPGAFPCPWATGWHLCCHILLLLFLLTWISFLRIGGKHLPAAWTWASALREKPALGEAWLNTHSTQGIS